MKFTPLQVCLKNGTTILIREAVVSDAEALIPVAKEDIERSEYISYVEGEFNPTVEEEEKWIRSLVDADNSLLLLAFCDNCIVGNLSINGEQKQMMKHTAGVGIALCEDFRGLGLGTMLFRSAIDWAKKNPSLEYLWLDVFATNEVGITLYKNMGFVETGIKKNFIKTTNGLYVDILMMALNLKQ